jgi:3-dehydroquinate synthase
MAIVDASVGIKTGVDWCCPPSPALKNRVGSFYAPRSVLVSGEFVRSQDQRNVANGLGEVMKLGLVRSRALFDLLLSPPAPLTAATIPPGLISGAIEVMLGELGPNLLEEELGRAVDFGHTFSKVLEMLPGADVMHGEAV